MVLLFSELFLQSSESPGQGQDGSESNKKQARKRAPRGKKRQKTGTQEGPEKSVQGAARCSIPACYLLLASQSPVFRAMFSTSFREGTGMKQADIQLTASGGRWRS